jgi:hypothetical protein
MSNSASEPIDLDVADASTASKRPQWTLPPRPVMPKTTDTSCEVERAFSGCKYTISDHRSRLGEDILEALECDGAWLRAGL